MRVELPQVLSVLVHELRSPLGVIQGYVRLLQRQHGEGDPDAPLLAAILEQTARISALGRQSTDLARISSRKIEGGGRVCLSTLCAEMLAHGAGNALSANITPALGEQAVLTADSAALALACSALADLTFREGSGAPVTVTVTEGDDADRVTLLITGKEPERMAVAGAATDDRPGPHPVPFDRGGQGLALVMASYVFDADQAEVVAARPGVIEIRLRKFRGVQ